MRIGIPGKLLLSTVLLLFLARVPLADAAQTSRHDVGYTWNKDIHRVLEAQKQLADLLDLAPDTQLQVVGRGQEYGVVRALQGSQAQANKMVGQQAQLLRKAGFTPATVKSNSYHRLYHIRYTQGANPQALHGDLARIKAVLGSRVGADLRVEQIYARTLAVIHHSWASRAAALRLAGQHAARLKSIKIPATIIAAASRPAVDPAAASPEPSRPAAGQIKARTATGVVDIEQTATPRIAAAGKQTGTPGAGKKPPPGRVASGSTGLNQQMEGFLQEQKEKGRIRRQERTAWVAYDLTRDVYLVSVNAQRPFQAASMIKPFVALAFFHQVDAGKLRYTAEHRRMMEAMIQHSSNSATNWFMRQVGGPGPCESILKRSYGRIFRQVRIREYIPGDGRTYVNSAPPSEYVHFLRALWKEQLPYAREMLRLMSLPGPDRIFYGTELPNGTLVYNKTGTTARLCGDMGILAPMSKNGKRVPYAIVGIVEGPARAEDYKQWMASSGGAIRDFSTLVYEAMKQKHNLP